ncbi:MAG: (Fe-S)-binding protein [Archaeoglobaceae archaeon]
MLNACMQCGTCSASCSVRFDLNLRRLIAEYFSSGEFWSPQLWNCTNCRICEDRCPRGIELTKYIREAKSRAVEEGRVPEELKKLLESVYKFGNPFGVGKPRRRSWIDRVDVKFAEKGNFEFLLFAGCATVDERIAEIAAKAAELLKACGIDFAVLAEEDCCGNDVTAIGEAGLFEELKERNLRVFERYGVRKIVTLSPHCYNAFRRYYGIESYHVTELLAGAIERADLKFRKVTELRVTYHDPCYLGRYNGIYDAPRYVISSIPGVELVEMQRNRELAICCGGGSGNVLRDFKVRPSLLRIDEAATLNVDAIAVACPFCYMMLEDAAKIRGGAVEVKDVVELVYDSVF